MRIKVLSLGLFFIYLFGCSASVMHNLKYEIVLEEVERPVEANEQYGEKIISATEEEGYRYKFEDEMIKILWFPSPTRLLFLLENKTNHSIRINWNKAAYVCEKGESHGVMHAGVRLIYRNDPQMPSVVEREGVITDFIYPADYVDYSYEGWVERPALSEGWVERPLLPSSKRGGDPQEFLNSAKSYIGKTIQVLLPIQLEDVTCNYIFIFEVKDVNLATK